MKKIFLLLTLLTNSNFILAAGFDCAKASSKTEKLICSDEKLSQLDDELTNVYKQAVKNSPTLKKEQINWLKTVRKCKDAKCITDFYNNRLLELSSLVETISDESNELDNESENEKQIKDVTSNSAVIKNETPVAPLPSNIESKDSMEEAKAEIIRQQQKQEEKEKILLEKEQLLEKERIILEKNKALEKERADFEKLKSTNETVLSQKNETPVIVEQQSSKSSTKDDSNSVDSKNEENKNKTIFFSIIALITGGWIWNKFIRRRCPECKSTKYILEKKTELDRFRQAKEVSERTASGKTKTTHVQVTYAINQYDYKCNVCGKSWSEKRKEEK